MIGYWLALLAALTPLLYWPGPGGFEALKVALFLVLAPLALLHRLYASRHSLILRPQASVLILILAALTVIRSLFVPAPNYAWIGTPISHFGTFGWLTFWWWLFLIVNTSFSKPEIKLLKVAAKVALIGILLSMLIQAFNLDSIDWYSFDDPSRARTWRGSIGGSSHLGSILVLLSILIFNRQKISTRSNLLSGFSLLAAFFTRSLTGLVLLPAALIVKYVFKHPRWQLVSLFLFISLPLILLLPPIYRLETRLAPSLADRADIWRAGLSGWQTTPWWGVGIEQFQFLYDENIPLNKVTARAKTEEHPHSLVIEILTEWGVIGLILFIGLGLILARDIRPSLILWLTLLAMQVNVIILPFIVLFLLSLALSLKKPVIAKSSSKRIPTFVLAVFWLGLNTSLAYSLVKTVVYSDKGERFASEGLFGSAVTEFKKASDVPWPSDFTYLQQAEAMTNLAITFDKFDRYEPVANVIARVKKGAPTKTNLKTIQTIEGLWQSKTTS